MDQRTTLRERKSGTTATYSQPCQVRIYVMEDELEVEPSGECNEDFIRQWAYVPAVGINRNHYTDIWRIL